eukprot:197241-Amphidinium_carterae.1
MTSAKGLLARHLACLQRRTCNMSVLRGWRFQSYNGEDCQFVLGRAASDALQTRLHLAARRYTARMQSEQDA